MSLSNRMNLQVKTDFVSAYGISDPGMKRDKNEDSILLDNQGNYFLLADGMGGQMHGARASSQTLKQISRMLAPDMIASELLEITESDGVPSEISGLCSIIENAVQTANTDIFQTNSRENEHIRSFMGTTVVGMYMTQEGHVILFHIGDSRIYRFRNGILTPVTIDHSQYEEWLKGGKTGNAPRKNVLTRAIGFFEFVETEINWQKYMRNDIYLLCSDGLTGMLPDSIIEKILIKYPDISDAVTVLINEANKAGGKDNVSAVLCRLN